MSRKKIEAFFERIESDKDLQAKLRRLAKENERKAIAQVVEIASAAGFKFTADELTKVRAKRVEFFPGFQDPNQAGKECCHWAQGCMPGFLLP